jgi:peptidoglycan/LPS O-acetylase OafA/YrhL
MKYRPEIDGLRALAVVPVILFHAGFSVFSGGYVGVDVFFVISGYLITSILISEFEEERFSISRFYERRARRILPALFVVMLACLPFAYMWMLPSQLKDFAQSLVAVVFFGSNILFWRESGYFAADAEIKPLLHTWSLAVEEQYYIVFPIFLLLAWRFGRNKVFWSVVLIAAISLLLSEWGWRNKPSANFYLAPTRAWELFAGSICAFLTVGRTLKSNNVLSGIGLAAIIFAIFTFDKNTPFPSVYALVPVVGTALIILFGRQGTLVANLLSMRAFVGIGLISYSAYLWHQPLFAFARLRSLTEPSNTLMAVLAVAALLLAWVTWRWVEQPFRKRTNLVLVTQRSVFAASGAVGAVFVALGLAGHVGNGFGWRSSGIATFDERVMVNHGLHTDCEGALGDSRNCFTSITPNVLLWGDSYAMHLAQGIIASEDNVALQQHTMSNCSPVLGIATVNARHREDWAQKCIAFNEQVMGWLRQQQSVDLVILSSSFSQLLGDSVMLDNGELKLDSSIRFIADKIRNTAREIRKTEARVVVVSPTPSSGWNNGQCLIRSVYYGMNEASCDFALDTDKKSFALLRSAADNVAVYWLHEDFCENETCDVLKDNNFIYRDIGHLSKEGSAYLGRNNHWLEKFRLMAN